MYLHCIENLISVNLNSYDWVLQGITISVLCLGSDLIFSKSVLLHNHYKCTVDDGGHFCPEHGA